MKVEEKLALNKYDQAGTPHIVMKKELCDGCDAKSCVYACPAECFVEREGHVSFAHEGCLECGSCRVACPKGALDWAYPPGGFGICYQYG